MNPAWSEWLQSTSALIEGGIVRDFGNPQGELQAARSEGVLADLSHLGLLDVQGEDSETFLQGQLTCDVAAIEANSSSYASHCTPKGRIYANYLIWRFAVGSQVGFRMAVSKSIIEAARKRIAMYVLRSKVQISDISDAMVLLGCAGDSAPKALESLNGLAPHRTKPLDGGGTALALPGGRYLLELPVERASALWSALASKLRPVGAPCWEWLDIRSGVPLVTARTQEQFLPQMMNLELLGGVSFKKGCFTGQEVVARTQHLGKVKRRMFLAHLESAGGQTPPQPGDELYSDDIPEQTSGMVVNAQPAPDGGFDLLGVVHLSSRESSMVHWRSAAGPVLRFEDLPYAVS